MITPASVRKVLLRVEAIVQVRLLLFIMLLHQYLISLDLDECSNGHIDKYGHYCPSDARCVNTLGGFVCQCPKGFKFVDQGDFSSTCESTNCSVVCYCLFIVTVLMS